MYTDLLSGTIRMSSNLILTRKCTFETAFLIHLKVFNNAFSLVHFDEKAYFLLLPIFLRSALLSKIHI